jgi:hypothetical protein
VHAVVLVLMWEGLLMRMADLSFCSGIEWSRGAKSSDDKKKACCLSTASESPPGEGGARRS